MQARLQARMRWTLRSLALRRKIPRGTFTDCSQNGIREKRFRMFRGTNSSERIWILDSCVAPPSRGIRRSHPGQRRRSGCHDGWMISSRRPTLCCGPIWAPRASRCTQPGARPPSQRARRRGGLPRTVRDPAGLDAAGDQTRTSLLNGGHLASSSAPRSSR